MIRDVSFAFHIPATSLLKLFSILPRTICNHFSHTPDNLLKPFPTPCENYFLLYNHDALKTRFSDAIMPYPKLVPINSDWPMIRFPEFPRKTHIVHKMAQGNLDLETGLSESRLREILSRWNTEGIMVVQTGKSFVLRIPVSPLNRLEDFSLQTEKVQKVLDGIQTFRNCLKEYDLMPNAGTR